MLIGDRDARAVVFHLAHNLNRLAPQAILGTAQEVLHLLDRVAVAQALHGALVHHLLEALAQVAAHALGGRQRVEALGVRLLQVLELSHHVVIVLVAYHRLVEHIVVVVVAVELVAQLHDALHILVGLVGK